MARLRTTIVSTLRSISDEDLEEITADGQVFASAEWYRLLDRLDPTALIGGQVDLRFAVVTADDVPIAIAPILRASGDGVYFVYSLRRYFFEHWIEEAVRMEPDRHEHFSRLMTGVSAYRRLLEWSGAKLGECLIVTNPLSYRGSIPVAPSAPVERSEVYARLVHALQRHARRQRLPLWFLCVPQVDNRLARALEEGGCQPVFQFHDNRIHVEPYRSFDEYLASFRRTTRRAFVRDMRRTEEAGVEFRIVEDFRRHADRFAELYAQTYDRYGKSYFRHPPAFWSHLNDSLGSNAEAIVAEHEGRLIGFGILLKSPRRGELWTYRIGRGYDAALDRVPYYFGLSFYAPIQRAIELGYRRVWLGPASYEAKSVRGAKQSPLYSYFWFPRRWDRWFLMPYLRLFGRVAEEQIDASIDRPIRREETKSSQTPRSPKSS